MTLFSTSLSRQLKRRVNLIDSGLAYFLVSDSIKALHHLHKADKIGHGDVKPDNLMLMNSLEVGIFDFGHSTGVKDNYPKKEVDGYKWHGT
jgi:serine/threonine protein kinase